MLTIGGVPLFQAPNCFSSRGFSSESYVAGNDERGIAGLVILLPEIEHLFALHGLQRIHGADVRVAVGVFRTVQSHRVDAGGGGEGIVFFLHQGGFAL
jgi:hypothetical protein